MQIEVDEKAIAEVLQKQSSAAVSSAMSDWSIKNMIEKALTSGALGNTIAAAVEQAASNIGQERLVAALTAEIERTITRSAVHILRETTVEIVWKLRGGNDYDSTKKKDKARLAAELFGRQIEATEEEAPL